MCGAVNSALMLFNIIVLAAIPMITSKLQQFTTQAKAIENNHWVAQEYISTSKQQAAETILARNRERRLCKVTCHWYPFFPFSASDIVEELVQQISDQALVKGADWVWRHLPELPGAVLRPTRSCRRRSLMRFSPSEEPSPPFPQSPAPLMPVWSDAPLGASSSNQRHHPGSYFPQLLLLL